MAHNFANFFNAFQQQQAQPQQHGGLAGQAQPPQAQSQQQMLNPQQFLGNTQNQYGNTGGNMFPGTQQNFGGNVGGMQGMPAGMNPEMLRAMMQWQAGQNANMQQPQQGGQQMQGQQIPQQHPQQQQQMQQPQQSQQGQQQQHTMLGMQQNFRPNMMQQNSMMGHTGAQGMMNHVQAGPSSFGNMQQGGSISGAQAAAAASQAAAMTRQQHLQQQQQVQGSRPLQGAGDAARPPGPTVAPSNMQQFSDLARNGGQLTQIQANSLRALVDAQKANGGQVNPQLFQILLQHQQRQQQQQQQTQQQQPQAQPQPGAAQQSQQTPQQQMLAFRQQQLQQQQSQQMRPQGAILEAQAGQPGVNNQGVRPGANVSPAQIMQMLDVRVAEIEKKLAASTDMNERASFEKQLNDAKRMKLTVAQRFQQQQQQQQQQQSQQQQQQAGGPRPNPAGQQIQPQPQQPFGRPQQNTPQMAARPSPRPQSTNAFNSPAFAHQQAQQQQQQQGQQQPGQISQSPLAGASSTPVIPPAGTPQSGSAQAQMARAPNVLALKPDQFMRAVSDHMAQRNLPFQPAPFINNQRIDLYRLFQCVHAQGGSEQVGRKNMWPAIVTQLEVAPPSNPRYHELARELESVFRSNLGSFEEVFLRATQYHYQLAQQAANNARPPNQTAQMGDMQHQPHQQQQPGQNLQQTQQAQHQAMLQQQMQQRQQQAMYGARPLPQGMQQQQAPQQQNADQQQYQMGQQTQQPQQAGQPLQNVQAQGQQAENQLLTQMAQMRANASSATEPITFNLNGRNITLGAPPVLAPEKLAELSMTQEKFAQTFRHHQMLQLHQQIQQQRLAQQQQQQQVGQQPQNAGQDVSMQQAGFGAQGQPSQAPQQTQAMTSMQQNMQHLMGAAGLNAQQQLANTVSQSGAQFSIEQQQAAQKQAQQQALQQAQNSQQNVQQTQLAQLAQAKFIAVDQRQLEEARAVMARIDNELSQTRPRLSVNTAMPEAEREEVLREVSRLAHLLDTVNALLPVFYAMQNHLEPAKRLKIMAYMFKDQLDLLPSKQCILRKADLDKLRMQMSRCIQYVRSSNPTISDFVLDEYQKEKEAERMRLMAQQQQMQAQGSRQALQMQMQQAAQQKGASPAQQVGDPNANESLAAQINMKRGLRVEDLKPPPAKKGKGAQTNQKAAASPAPAFAPSPKPTAANDLTQSAAANAPTPAAARGKKAPARGGKKRTAEKSVKQEAAAAQEKPAKGKGKGATAKDATAATPASTATDGAKDDTSPSHQQDEAQKMSLQDANVEQALQKLKAEAQQSSQDPAGFAENAWQELLSVNGSAAGASSSIDASSLPTDGKTLESLLSMLNQQNGLMAPPTPPPTNGTTGAGTNGTGVITNGENDEQLSAFEQADQQADVDLLDFLDPDAMGPDSTAGPEEGQQDLDTLLANTHSTSASMPGDTPDLVDSSRASSSTTSSSFNKRFIGPDFGGTSWTSASPVSGTANTTLARDGIDRDEHGGNSAATARDGASPADVVKSSGSTGQDSALAKIVSSRTDANPDVSADGVGDYGGNDAHSRDDEDERLFNLDGPELDDQGQPIQQWAIFT